MLIFIEDLIIIKTFINVFSMILFIKFFHFKIEYFKMFLIVFLLTFISLAFPFFNKNYLKILAILIYFTIPIFYVNGKNIFQFVDRAFVFAINIFVFNFAVISFDKILMLMKIDNNVFLILSELILTFTLMLKIYSLIIVTKIKKQNTCDIHINGKLKSAVLDSGNNITYKNNQVVVLNEYSDNLKKTDVTIPVFTINSKKLYTLYYIKEFSVSTKDSENFYYNVPAIIEDKNDKIVLPLNYC